MFVVPKRKEARQWDGSIRSLLEIFHRWPELVEMCEAFTDQDTGVQSLRFRLLIGAVMGDKPVYNEFWLEPNYWLIKDLDWYNVYSPEEFEKQYEQA